MRKRPQILKSLAGLILMAFCFSFSAKHVGSIIITVFSDHSHEAQTLLEHGKARLILVHHHDATVFNDEASSTGHPDHEFRFMDVDMPYLLTAKSGVFALPLGIPACSSASCLPVITEPKTIVPLFDPRPHPLLVRVRSTVILV